MRVSLVLAGCLVAASSSALAQSPAADSKPVAPKPVHSFDLASMNKSADPCVNFYQYACGNWSAHNPIPADKPIWSSFGIVGQQNQYKLWKLLDTAAKDPKTPLERQYGTYYASCMDTTAINAKGGQPLKPSFAAIDAMQSKAGIGKLIGSTEYAVGGFFDFDATPDQKNAAINIAEVDQDGLNMPDRDYYLSPDPDMVKNRAKYHDYIVKVMGLAGETPAQAKTTADDVLRIETALAKVSMPRDEQRDPDKVYHIMTLSELHALAPQFDWTGFFEETKAPAFSKLNVAEPDFFKGMNAVIAQEPLAALKNYLRFDTVNGMATRLSTSFDDTHFDFYGRVLNGQAQQQARWKRCSSATDQALGEAVGQGWVKAYFPPAAKQQMQVLVGNLEKALGDDIQQLAWMSPETKTQAHEKLSLFRQKIGYPDTWRKYDGIEVKQADWAANAHRADIFNSAYQLNHIGKPVNEKEWGMTPPTVNAYYEDPTNDINFPAGILQPPFYQLGIDPAVNYGAIGAVIGHEMTHGFDDQGSKFDGHGNKRDWFNADDRKKFDARTDCEVQEYGKFSPLPGQHLNGKLTLGENTADNGGLRIAYAALQKAMASEPEAERTKKIDGFTPDQRFFLSWGQIWCEAAKPQMAQMLIKVDPHSPGEFRANGTVQNFPAFAQAFGCHQGQPMVAQNACRVW